MGSSAICRIMSRLSRSSVARVRPSTVVITHTKITATNAMMMTTSLARSRRIIR